VQASANFPVAFPYRIFHLDCDEYRFKLRTGPGSLMGKPMPSLALSDGGVQDNMGITWFADNAERTTDLKRRFGWDRPRLPKSDCDRIEGQLVAMDDRPDLLLVVNSSWPPPWTAQIGWMQRVPLIGEVLALLSVQRVMYNHRGREQSRQLHRSFINRSMAGALMSIECTPQLFYNFFRLSEESFAHEPLLEEFGLSDVPHPLLQHYRQRARRQALRNKQIYGPQRIAEQNSRANEEMHISLAVPTTLRPLGIAAASALLRHGYLNCMNICCLLHEGFPYFDDPRRLRRCRGCALAQLETGIRVRSPCQARLGTAVRRT